MRNPQRQAVPAQRFPVPIVPVAQKAQLALDFGKVSIGIRTRLPYTVGIFKSPTTTKSVNSEECYTINKMSYSNKQFGHTNVLIQYLQPSSVMKSVCN